MEVLIVDDCEHIRVMAGIILGAAGFAVVEAVNGEAGLAKFETSRPDVILTDINMPIMDGLTLIERVRALPSGKTVPIVVLSSDGRRENVDRARRSGISCWIDKPINPQQIAAAVALAVQ